MAEQLDLTDAIVPPSITYYRVDALTLDRGQSIIHVRLLGSDGTIRTHTYRGATALTLLSALNTANLSTQSLNTRVLNRLITDGVLDGTISGSPE